MCFREKLDRLDLLELMEFRYYVFLILCTDDETIANIYRAPVHAPSPYSWLGFGGRLCYGATVA